jgi:hypothetical protein
VLGLVSTEKAQQHWKQAAEETEYDGVRAQLNKIKFTTILIFIPYIYIYMKPGILFCFRNEPRWQEFFHSPIPHPMAQF